MTDGPFRPRGRPPSPPEPEAEPAPSRPGPRTEPPRPPAGLASQTTWILGVAVVLLLAYITVNTIRADKPGSRGVKAGTDLPPFAAPLVTGPIADKDANVLVKASRGVPRACDVRGPGIVNSCQLAEEGPVVLAFLATRSQQCVDEIDVVNRLQARFPQVRFAAVAIRGDRGDVRRLVARHGWTLPVAWDRDGAVANAYAIAVCPTITFARQGGKVTHTTLGEADRAEIVRRVEAIVR
jgi:hypothetical protein